jgi:polyisoprenoid-binding protein YceI
MKNIKTWGFLLLLAGLALPVRAADYKIDPDHSTVGFKIRHLIGKVNGRFDKYTGTFAYDPQNLKAFKASATIDATSINTNVGKRDDHLRSADFFDVQKFPTLSFLSTSVVSSDKNKIKLRGDLTIHGVTKPVILDVEILGTIKDPWGNERASLVGTTTINRTDFGLTWNKVIEAGKLMVGEEVEITLEIEGVKL